MKTERPLHSYRKGCRSLPCVSREIARIFSIHLAATPQRPHHNRVAVWRWAKHHGDKYSLVILQKFPTYILLSEMTQVTKF